MSDRQITAIIKGMNNVAERVVKKITLDVTANLVELNPVDTGWSRANWVPAIGAPSVGGMDVGNVGRRTADEVADARGQQEEAISDVADYRLGQGSVFVSNGVPYIQLLENGSSKQAPDGFVKQAIYKAVTQDLGRMK